MRVSGRGVPPPCINKSIKNNNKKYIISNIVNYNDGNEINYVGVIVIILNDNQHLVQSISVKRKTAAKRTAVVVDATSNIQRKKYKWISNNYYEILLNFNFDKIQRVICLCDENSWRIKLCKLFEELSSTASYSHGW
ncbi:hypothetical protein PV327_007100 [Microctonus hyperodae]|uniref:Uncharacterized protein n=1 Tax=Microctonus hyperodae TaxID=165561 RepID=A0AA39F5R7_MICHY|nr:hypothetical protein PV327_007100 [Microctonus hyperodae]